MFRVEIEFVFGFLTLLNFSHFYTYSIYWLFYVPNYWLLLLIVVSVHLWPVCWCRCCFSCCRCEASTQLMMMMMMMSSHDSCRLVFFFFCLVNLKLCSLLDCLLIKTSVHQFIDLSVSAALCVFLCVCVCYWFPWWRGKMLRSSLSRCCSFVKEECFWNTSHADDIISKGLATYVRSSERVCRTALCPHATS